MDLRAINRVAVLNNYPLPLQKKILNYLIGIKYITVLDISNYFHQYRIHPKDRHIFTITSHRGLERPTVAIMGFRNNPAYVQQYMDTLLKPFQKFAHYYINNKVIFSKNDKEHAKQLRLVFSLFLKKNINLSPTKS